MTITAPNSAEWVKDGKATPAFIQYLDQFKDWINDRQSTIEAEALIVTEEVEEASKVATLSAHELDPLESDWYDPGSINYNLWIGIKASFTANSPVSNTQVRQMYFIWGDISDQIYYRVQALQERIDELESALQDSGQLEIT